MSAMTNHDKRIAEIEAREKAATPGPWEARAIISEKKSVIKVPGQKEWIGVSPEDGPFISHARQDIPWLVAQVKRLREQLAAYPEDAYECQRAIEQDKGRFRIAREDGKVWVKLEEENKRLREALTALYGANLNEMRARGLPHEWAKGSPMDVASKALEGE